MSRKQRIYHALSNALTPEILSVENESHNHHVPPDSETHFKIVAISSLFENRNRIERHRLINHLLTDELQSGLHAITLHLYTPTEWSKKTATVPASPLCQHK